MVKVLMSFMVYVDYFSGIIEVDALTSTTMTAIIKTLKIHMARHGIPIDLISDNGPQLVSEQFSQFYKSWAINHRTCSPRYPKSSGKAEAAVKQIKKLLKKCRR